MMYSKRLFLSFQIITLLGKISFKLSLSDKEYKDWEPFKSMVSNANKSKSSLWIESLEMRFPLDKIEIIIVYVLINYNREFIQFF